MTTRPPTSLTQRFFGPLRFFVLAALGVLLAHDAIFAGGAMLGADDAQFTAVGHRYWATFAALVLLAAAVTAVGVLAMLSRLTRALRGLPAPIRVAQGPGFGAELRRLWPRLFLVVTLVFMLQENIEHVATGDPLPGLSVLWAPGYPLAIPMLVIVTGLLAAVGAWLRHREKVLEQRLRAARLALALHHGPDAPQATAWHDLGWLFVRRLLLARPDAGRAPPIALLA